MTSAILLPRVSSDHQEDGFSLEAQTERLLTYAERRGFRVDRTIRIVESSTRGERRQFLDAIAYSRRLRGPVAILADSVDRVQRSFKESALIDELRQTGRIEFHFLRENLIVRQEMTPSEVLLWDFAIMNAKGYVASLSYNVRRSFAYKIDHGEWLSKAPVGYLNIIDPVTRKTRVVVDPPRATLIRQLFERYALGTSSVPQVAGEFQRKGLSNPSFPHRPLTTSAIRKVLQNPFYMGEMKISGKRYPHRYPPLISPSIFERCQRVRQSGRRIRVRTATIPFLYRGLIACARCGHTVSSEQKKGRWTYLACRQTECRGGGVREECLTATVVALLATLKIPPARLAPVEARLQGARRDRERARLAVHRLQRRRLGVLRRQIESCLDLVLKYPSQAQEWSRRLQALRKEEENLVHSAPTPSVLRTDDAEQLLNRAPNLFSLATLEQRRTLLATAFQPITFSPREAAGSPHMTLHLRPFLAGFVAS